MDTERIRRNNNSTKAQYALITASLVTGVIALIWVSTLPARFQNASVDSDSKSNEVTTQQTDTIDSFIQDAKSQLGNIVEGVKSQEESIGDGSALDSLGDEAVVEDVGSTEEDVVVEEFPAPEVPKTKMILIGTTTEKTAE
jgi:hypothetical protein